MRTDKLCSGFWIYVALLQVCTVLFNSFCIGEDASCEGAFDLYFVLDR